MRWVGLVFVIALLVVGWVGYNNPELFPGNMDIPGIVWAIMALMLVSGAGFGFRRIRHNPASALAALALWAAVIVAIVVAYPLFN